jgi:hypothetical protein
MHHPKKVRTWQAHRSLVLPVDAQHISIGLCMAQDGAAGIWSPSALASAELAVAELNQRNGIAGRQVRLVCLNACDESANFEDELLRAIDTHGIEALVGMHTSAVRERLELLRSASKRTDPKCPDTVQRFRLASGEPHCSSDSVANGSCAEFYVHLLNPAIMNDLDKTPSL